MRNALALLLLFVCLTAVRVEAADGDTSAPLTPIEHLLSVNAMVNGKGPYRFVIDSGAAGKLRISAELAKQLALEQAGEAVASDPSGRNMTKRPVVRAGSIEIAGLRFNDVDATVRNQGPDAESDGVIGLDLFGKRTVTIDYPKRELRITTRELPADLPHVVPFTLRHGVPAIDVDAAGVTIRADVDLGSPALLSVPPSIALPFKAEPQVVGHGRTATNEFDIKRAELRGDLHVAGFTEPNAGVDVVDIFPVANLGSRFLRQYAVTFDLANSRLMLARGGAGPQKRVNIGGGGPDEAKDWPHPELKAGLTPPQIADAIAACAQKLVDTDHFSGVVFAANGEKVLLERAWGLADRASNTPNTVDTKFNIGSINKVFTQTAIEQLAAAGKLSLDDTIRKHLPGYPSPVADKITIRQLLAHKSGLGDFFGPKYIAAPPSSLRELSDFLPLFADAPLQFEPGTSQRYSNAGYIVLGLIIEHASGEKYRDYVQQRIFAPAGMKDSGFWAVDESVAKRVTGYTKRGPEGPLPAREPNTKTLPGRPSSAGGAYSTARDLFRFFQWRHANGIGVGGGAPGLNASVEIDNGWTVIAMSNYDPPSAEALTRGAMAIVRGRDEE